MRSAFGTITRGLAAAIILSLIGCALQASSKGWRDGPVRGMLTEEEYTRFGELKSEAARQSFIEQFWSEVSGETGGAQNAYRELFERRCESANARFGSGAEDGWRTDRGRVFLALGEPSSIRGEPGDAHAVEKEIWSYGAAGGEPPSSLRVVFYRCQDGSYRLDSRCSVERDTTSVSFDDERADFLRQLRVSNPTTDSGRLIAMIADWLGPAPSGVSLQPPSLARPGNSQPSATARPSAVESAPSAHALEDGAYFFRAADGSVLTLLTLELTAKIDRPAPPAAETPATLLGAVTLEETDRRGGDLPETVARTVALEPVTGLKERQRAVFLGRVHLRGGRTYAVRYTVEDGASEEIFVRNALIGVPDLGSGFSASSIVPAERYGPAVPGSDRFQVGSEEVVPKPGGSFRRSELLRLYLQVYEAAIDPGTSKPRVDVVFRFYRTGNGMAKRYGKPFSVRGAAGASMGLALPIGDWPAGPYRVEVELHDRIAERRTAAEGQFSILED